ncbi:hypothetical protein ACFQX4_17990 [Roseomonas sp. GCM10028921]
MTFLRRRASEASITEDRTITPQQIILRLIEAEMARSQGQADG